MLNKRKRYTTLTHQEKMAIYNDIKSDIYYQKEICERHNISVYTLKNVEKEIYQLIRYKLYGEVPKFPTECNVCGGKVKFNACSKDKSRSGFVYYCTNCHAWVGTSPRFPKEALGELANKDIRKKRRDLHVWFDKLWKNHDEREKYYNRLAKELGKTECHFSQMSMEELEKAEKIVKKWWMEKYDR